MAITHETLDSFFDEIISTLRDSGALNTYQEEKQKCFDDIEPIIDEPVLCTAGTGNRTRA